MYAKYVSKSVSAKLKKSQRLCDLRAICEYVNISTLIYSSREYSIDKIRCSIAL